MGLIEFQIMGTEIDPDEIIRTNAKLGCHSWQAWKRLEFHQRGQTLWYLSAIPDTLFNSAVDCEESHAEFRSILLEICTEADRRKVPVAWMVNRETALSKQHLDSFQLQGFSQRGSTLGMLLDLTSFDHEDTFFKQGPFRIKEVRKRDELSLWAAMVMRTYGFPEQRIQSWADLHEQVGIKDDSVWQHYLVFQNGKVDPIAASSLFSGDLPIQATFANLAVSAEVRGQGIGSALTKWSLSKAKQLGHSSLSLYASAEAVELYRKLGFSSHHTNHLYYRAEPRPLR